jgi:hypothetical protein
MAEGDVYVGRPTKWGNPHRVGPLSAADAVARYRADLLAGRLPITVDDARRELRGRNLLCWCPSDHPCHADVLLDLANRPAG